MSLDECLEALDAMVYGVGLRPCFLLLSLSYLFTASLDSCCSSGSPDRGLGDLCMLDICVQKAKKDSSSSVLGAFLRVRGESGTCMCVESCTPSQILCLMSTERKWRMHSACLPPSTLSMRLRHGLPALTSMASGNSHQTSS